MNFFYSLSIVVFGMMILVGVPLWGQDESQVPVVFPKNIIDSPLVPSTSEELSIEEPAFKVKSETPVVVEDEEVPFLDEGTRLKYSGLNIEIGLVYNYSFHDLPHGITLLARLSAEFNKVHEFGSGIFFTSYYKDNFLTPDYASEIRVPLFYRINILTGSFMINHNIQIGPGFYLKGTNSPYANSYFFYIQPEFDFEFWFTRFFSLSIPVGYVLNVLNIVGAKLNTSHIYGGIVWRWRI